MGRMGRGGHGARWLFLPLVLTMACGEDGGVEVDPAVAPFVGTWDAEAFTMTSDADPEIVVDVLQFGAFWIRVEPSGQYNVGLEVPGGRGQVGQLTVIDGSTLRLDVTTPPGEPSATSSYVFQSPDYLVLDGPSEFDFNVDQTNDPAQAHIELQRR